MEVRYAVEGQGPAANAPRPQIASTDKLIRVSGVSSSARVPPMISGPFAGVGIYSTKLLWVNLLFHLVRRVI